MLKNHVGIILDRSGSMGNITSDVIRTFNSWVDQIRKDTISQGQETSVTFTTFANRSRVEFFNADCRTLKKLTLGDYRPSGMTALCDGVVETVDTISKIEDPNTSYLILVITDGEENNSRAENISRMRKLIKDKQQSDNWTFVFLVPPSGKHYALNLGVTSDNIREWDNSTKGVKEAEEITTSGLSNYFQARSCGQRSVSNFFVTTDLSNVQTSDLKKELVDVSNKCKLFRVDTSNAVIREFVESKTHKSYQLGKVYYQLVKREKIQSNKLILVKEKGRKPIWAGDEARNLIGLPDNADAKVNPGDHGKFEIFVQSTSVNRKLPEGTQIIVIQ